MRPGLKTYKGHGQLQGEALFSCIDRCFQSRSWALSPAGASRRQYDEFVSPCITLSLLTSTTGWGTKSSVCHSAYNPCFGSSAFSPLAALSARAISTARFLLIVAALILPIFSGCCPLRTVFPAVRNQFSADLSTRTFSLGNTGSPRNLPICVCG